MSGPNEPAPGTATRPLGIGIVGTGAIAAVHAGAIDTLGGRACIEADPEPAQPLGMCGRLAVWNLEGAQ